MKSSGYKVGFFPSGKGSSISHLKKSSESHLTVPKKGKFHQIAGFTTREILEKIFKHFNANGIESSIQIWISDSESLHFTEDEGLEPEP